MRSFSLWCSFWSVFFEKMSYCVDDGIGNECVENEVHECLLSVGVFVVWVVGVIVWVCF